MSVQILLRGKLLRIEDFLIAPCESDSEFLGRANWVSLLTEVLPRALLAEFKLARILLGTSGGDQFLVVLPSEYRDQAQEFLNAAAGDAAKRSSGRIRLIWSMTESLGDWSDIRKRLQDELAAKEGTPGYGAPPVEPVASSFAEFNTRLAGADAVSWSPDSPAGIDTTGGTHSWPIDGSAESILFARNSTPEPVRNTGVLRGDVDNFGIRLRKLQTVEEHLQLSLMLRQFFAGELKILCSMPEFWTRVEIIYSGGDDFAVRGEWDALLSLAREIQRVFHAFAEANLKDFPGPEGKTVTMALATDPTGDTPCAALFEQAGSNLDRAKSEDKDCIFALGRILEWKQLGDAADLKSDLTRLVADFGASPEYLDELCGIYRETASARVSRKNPRPWRYHRRLNRIIPLGRSRDEQKARQDLIAGFVGKNAANVKLRPSGRVALEWARLSHQPQATGNQES